MMDPVLEAALRAGEKIVHLVTVALPATTIRWTDGGFVIWAGQTYQARNPVYGTLAKIGDIKDGIDDDASPVELEILAPSLTSFADLAAADAQGGLVTIHIGAVNRTTGLLVGEPYELHRGELDRPLVNTRDRSLKYEILTAEALCLEPNEEQRQSDAFHQSIWAGERGYEHQTDGTKITYWREEDPRNAIGYFSRRRKKGGTPTEFNYDPDAAWAFPFGRVELGGALNFRVGFGPTSRFNSIVTTVAASGPIQGYVGFRFSDIDISFNSDGMAVAGDHEGAMWLQTKLGTQPQAALTFPSGIDVAGLPPIGWGASHGQSGKAVFMVTMLENSKKTEYGGGVPTVRVTVDGLRGWDPRVDGCEIDDPASWPMIENGVIADLNWTIGRWEGPSVGGGYGVPYASAKVGGLGAALANIDLDRVIEAADVADTNDWKVSDAPTSAESKHEVRERLLRSAGAVPARICGKITCISEAMPRASRLTVTNRDTAGPMSFDAYASRLDRRNYGIARFRSLEHRSELTAIAPVSNPAWVTQDGGRRSTGSTFESVPNATQAAQLIYLELAHAREMTGETPFLPWLLTLEPGDCFTFAEPQFLLEGVKVQVRSRTWSPEKMALKIAWRRETDTKYAEALAQVGIAPPPTTTADPPGPFVEPPTDFIGAAVDGSSELYWRNPMSLEFDHVELYRAAGGGAVFASAVSIDFYAGSPGEYVSLTDPTPGSGTWRYWVVAFDTSGNASSPVGPVTITIP